MKTIWNHFFSLAKATAIYWLQYINLRVRHKYSHDLARIFSLRGLTSFKELQLLYDLARNARGGAIIEIGSHHGISTAALALGTRSGQNVPFYAIDPYMEFTGPLGGTFGPKDKEQLAINLVLADVMRDVWLVHLTSMQAVKCWEGNISLLWIDGDHSYEGVKGDFDSWTPYLIHGGIIAFHDSLDQKLGPYHLIEEILKDCAYEKIDVVQRTTVLQKKTMQNDNAGT